MHHLLTNLEISERPSFQFSWSPSKMKGKENGNDEIMIIRNRKGEEDEGREVK